MNISIDVVRRSVVVAAGATATVVLSVVIGIVQWLLLVYFGKAPYLFSGSIPTYHLAKFPKYMMPLG